jgi:hypothetical protein
MTTPLKFNLETVEDWKALNTALFAGNTVSVQNKIDMLHAYAHVLDAQTNKARAELFATEERDTNLAFRQLVALRMNEVEELRQANNIRIGLENREVEIAEKAAGIASPPDPPEIPPPPPLPTE